MIDFLVEEALIDKYVDVKDDGKGDPIIVKLIEDHFLPHGRLEEAQSWLSAIGDKGLRSEAGKLVKAAMASTSHAAIFRFPKNKDWEDANAEGRSENTPDQQYHYDRTLKYMVMTETMLDEIDDVRVCRNEWITFVARNAYTGGLSEMGATMETLSQAISDYVEYFLLAGVFDGEDDASQQESGSVPLLNNPLRSAASGRQDILQTLEGAGYSQYLDSNFIANYSGFTANSGGKCDEMVFTDAGVFLLREKMFGSFNGQVQHIPYSSISNIEIGSDIHTEHAGFTSSTTEYWILTINTNDYQSYSRWLVLGQSESQINQNRPGLMKFINSIAPFFQLVEGDSWSTSGGFTTSYGFYW